MQCRQLEDLEGEDLRRKVKHEADKKQDFEDTGQMKVKLYSQSHLLSLELRISCYIYIRYYHSFLTII